MSKGARAGLLGLAAAIAIVVFVLARPEEASEKADDPAPRSAQGSPPADGAGPTATARSALPPPPTEIVLRGREPQGGPARIEVNAGATARFVVTSDAPDEIHLHGYDITKQVAPGRPARFSVKADLEGAFEVESHQAGDEGKDALVATLVVDPS